MSGHHSYRSHNMSGHEHRSHHRSGPGGFLNSLLGTLTRRSTASHQEPSPEPEDLGLKALRQVYGKCMHIVNPLEKERQIYKILPLFCINCGQYQKEQLVTKFPEVYEFAEDTATVFLSHVRNAAQDSNPAMRALSILRYFEPSDDIESSGAGFTILKVVKILAEGPESLIDVVMNNSFCSVLVQCVSLLLELPPPGGGSGQGSPHTNSPAGGGTPTFGSYGSRSGSRGTPTSYGSPRNTPTSIHHAHRATPPTYMSSKAAAKRDGVPSNSSPSPPSEVSLADQAEVEMAERQALQNMIMGVLNKLVRIPSAVRNLLKEDSIRLLFGAITSACPQYNKIWRKCAAHCLITMCRYSLSSQVIEFIHSRGCIGFCVHNLSSVSHQPPLEVVEIMATLFCCLKDSADFSQVLLEDFTRSKGYKVIYDYLLQLEHSSNSEAIDAQRNLVLLVQNLAMAGFLNLEPAITDGGPFQDSSFKIPIPVNQGSTVKNLEAFQVLQDTFLACKTTPLGLVIINTLLYIFKSDPANYFIAESFHALSTFIEHMAERSVEVQQEILKVVDYIIVEQGYVPVAELTSIGLLLNSTEHPKTVCLALNFLLRLISYHSRFRRIFRDVGIFIMLITALKSFARDMLEGRAGQDETDGTTPTVMSSPSLPLESFQGDEDECMFLLMECLRAIIEGEELNGQVFRENEGTKLALALVRYRKPRRMALKLLRQMILLDDGAQDFNSLLNYLNQAAQTSVNIKAEILLTVLAVFQLDSSKKAVFREVSGFHYIISVLASLLGSLTPVREEPWVRVPRADILKLIQLLFTVMTSAMQDDPANRNFFEKDIRYDSFSAPLLLLGCFSRDATKFPEATPTFKPPDNDSNNNIGDGNQDGPSKVRSPAFQTSGSFLNFEAEFKTWKQPSEHLDEDTFIFSAAEVFRFLRDMALDIPGSQSTSILETGAGGKAGTAGGKGKEDLVTREKNFYGAPPVTNKKAAVAKFGSQFQHLIHPGAVLCMVDLLPSLAYSEDMLRPQTAQGSTNGRTVSPLMVSDRSVSPLSDGDMGSSKTNFLSTGSVGGGLGTSPSQKSEESYFDVEEVLVGVAGEKEEPDAVALTGMKVHEIKQWCMFLQERVVSEIYTLATSERNQQALCQVGLPQRILMRCHGVLADETHPLHQALERTFEKLSYQALTPSDFRQFLRLGNPLCCYLNDVTLDELSAGKFAAYRPKDKEGEEPDTPPPPPFGGSLSLARIQSLVSMTTPRDGFQPVIVGAPPFVEFDLSIDGFGCLFLPSVFPISEPTTAQNAPPQQLSSSGVGEGGRSFPSHGGGGSGLTFTCWVLITKYSAEDHTSRLALLTLSQTRSVSDTQVKHYPILRIYLKLSKQTLCLSTHQSREDPASSGVAVVTEEELRNTTVFECEQLFLAQSWNHVAVVMHKPALKGKAKAMLFINGQSVGTQKMSHVHILHSSSLSPQSSDPNQPVQPVLINAHIGTHVTSRHVSMLTYRMGPTFLIEEHLSANVIGTMFRLGPSYLGSFQAPIVQDLSSPSSTHGHALPPLIAEEKLLFGLIATHPLIKTIHELDKMYTPLDVTAIRRELSLSEHDDVTPVTLLHNTAVHLSGPSRTLGAVMCGYSGIRFFQPQPLRSLLSSVGGTRVVLGLVAMATTVDNLYASMKALVCIVGNNQVALREMERTGGFKVLGMLLRSKSHLINSNILHLTYTLVGTVDSEQESACIPNLIAFQDLLADLAVWSTTSEDIQRSLFSHFFDLLSHTSHKYSNAELILNMKMVSLLLFRLLDDTLTIRTIKAVCNVISALLGIQPRSEDIQRVGQLLATTLPSNQKVNENTISLYDDDEGSTHSDCSEQAQFGRFRGDEGKQQRAIVLRNILLDVLISLLTRDLEVNHQFASELYQSLGFDWLFLFMHATIHTETVVRAVRILVQLLSNNSLRLQFLNGDIFGGWTKGFESISMEMTNLVVKSLTYLNPFQYSSSSSSSSQQQPPQFIPGPSILANLLPSHSEFPQIYLLLSANMLGCQCTDIPFNARFDMETLEEVFHIGDPGVMRGYRVSGEAACVLLTVARTLLHKDPNDAKLQENAVVLIKFFERLYKTLPEFRKLASTTEFIDSLVGTLFPPITYQEGVGASVSDVEVFEGGKVAEEKEGDDWIVVDTDVIPGTGGKEDGDAILNYRNNLAVCTILKLLRTIAIDGFSSAQPMTKDLPASCPILERVLSATPSGLGQRLIREYQTRILLNMMDHLQKGSEDIMVVFREGVLGANLDRSLCGLSVFCSRVVDKVWQNVFQDSTQSVYTFLFWMVEQARKTPKQMPLMDLQRSLNRLILFQVSNIPTTEVEQKAFMDTLCMYSSQAHVIFDETNVEDQFLECLTYCLLKIALYEKYLAKNPLLQKMDSMTEEGATKGVDTSSLHGKVPSGYVPGSLAMMKSGANRLWTKMLEHKKADLDRLLQVELPYPGDNHHNREVLVGHQIPHQTFSTGNRTFLRLQNCHLFLTDNLERVWKDFVAEEKSIQSLDTMQQRDILGSSAAASTLKKGTGLVAAMASKVRKKSRAVISKDELVHEFVSVLCHLMILLSQKFYELLLRKHQRNVEYSLRFAALEWSKIEYELTRERGLWGPDKSSPLDKWMVDTVEGPCRMRKRLQRNHEFFKQYPFQPKLTTAVKSKYHKPSSSDSELQAIRDRLFQRPTILATPTTHLTATPRGNEAAAKPATEPTSVPSGSVPVYGPSSNTIFNHPDSDDPIAQTLYKMIEPDDKVTKQYQCARLTGLDSRDGVLLLGSTHFYVIEGITITRTGGMMDIESVPRDLYEPVVPGNVHPHAEKVDQEIPIECIKWSYDTLREIHKRRYLLRHCAIEVFSSDGRSHFLIFHPKYRDKIYHKLVSLSKSSLTQGDSHYIAGIHPEMDPEQSQGIFSVLTGERSLVEKWVNGEMSNFQYLMHLNTLAGRSYNDLMQYPIFPWILADYGSENLDLTNPKTFRDLSKPMGALNEQRLSRFIERYRFFEDPTGENTPPYYYGTHYSSAMIVASYLIRMEPFTQYFLKLQGGHFDLPDRLFHSIPDAWRSASESNMADVKELIPEFFYLPEFLTNSNSFELGTKQSGEKLGSIILPPWSKGDPQEFIRVHREALECDYVSANLHKWIDLIFGYKQKGEEALASHNVFHHLFYEGAVDIDKIEDPMKRNAAISFIHNFGQMPKQLFKKPHRQRKILTTPISQDASAATPANLVDSQRVFYKNLVRLMPSKEPLRIIPDKVNQMVCPDHKFPLAVDNNKIFLSWGNYKYYFNWGFPDHSARISTVDQDKIVSMFEGLHQGRILCAAIADDATLLTGGESTVVCVWEIGSGGGKERLPSKLHLKHTLHGHTAPVCCLSTSLTYNLIVSGSRDKTCILWDMTNFSFVRQLCDHSGPVTALAINQLNGNVVSCTKNQIRLWTVNGTLLAETPLMLSSSVRVLCCAVSELFDWDKDNVIVTGSSDGIVRMWCLEYVSEEEMLQNTKIRRGSPADSMLSGVSGGESVLDFTAPRDRLASHVVGKLKKATLSTGGASSRHRSKSSPLHHADLLSLEDDELFRSTGQIRHSSPSKQSATSAELSDGADSALGGVAMASSLPGREGMSKVPKSLLRTLSQDEEEERTVGSGIDLLSEDAYYPSGTSPTPSGGMADQGVEFGSHDGTESDSPKFVVGGEEFRPHDQDTVDGGNSNSKEFGVASDEEKGVAGDKEVGMAGDKEVGVAEKQEKGVAEEKQLTEMEKLAEMNPAYAKYIMEKKKASEELRLRTGKWYRRLKLVHTLTMHTSYHRKDNDKPAAVTSLCISKDHRKLFIGDSIGRIFSWTVTDNLGGVMQHWVNDSAVNSCYNCKVEFSTFERKHHCRDCGQIFCAKCSNFEGEVERLRIHKKVRVCALCFEKNRSEKHRLFRAPSDIDAT